MPIQRFNNDGTPLEAQILGREIGQLRAGMTIPNPKPGGRPIPTSLETIRFTTRYEPAAERLAELYDSKPNRTVLANGQPTIEVMTKVEQVRAIIPPGGAAISQWREMWGPGFCKRRCDAVTETKTQSPCMCPADAAERQALAVKGQACKDTSRVNVILPDVPGLGVWRLTTNSYHAGIEMGNVVEKLARLSAQGLPLPVFVGIDPRSKVLEPKGPNDKPQTTKFVVWRVDPEDTMSEIAAKVESGYGMREALSPTSSLALGTGTAPAPSAPQNSARALPSQPSPNGEEIPDSARADAPASNDQQVDIRTRMAQLDPRQSAELSDWWGVERKAKRLHPIARLLQNEVPIVLRKLDEIAGIHEAEIVDPDNESAQ